MADSPLTKKLLIKPGNRVYIAAAPDGFAIPDLPEGASVVDAPPADVAIVFVRNSAGVDAWIAKKETPVAEGGRFWMAYPKKTGSIKTDVTRDTIWPQMRAAGWEANAQVALDDTWSAMRFRPTEAAK